jgi:transcriptional regulator with XRE-family HTH domain
MLNKALKLLRVYHDMKAVDLADKLGMPDSSFVSLMEKGRRKVTMEMLQKYANVFDMKPQEILTFAEKIEHKKGLEVAIIKSIKKTIAEY